MSGIEVRRKVSSRIIIAQCSNGRNEAFSMCRCLDPCVCEVKKLNRPPFLMFTRRDFVALSFP